MTCLLDDESQKNLQILIAAEFRDIIESPDIFDIDNYIKNTYDWYLSVSDDKLLALDAARLIPTFALQILGVSKELKDGLRKKDIKIVSKLDELEIRYNDDINNVKQDVKFEESNVELSYIEEDFNKKKEIEEAQEVVTKQIAEKKTPHIPLALRSVGREFTDEGKINETLKVNFIVIRKIADILRTNVIDAESGQINYPGVKGGIFFKVTAGVYNYLNYIVVDSEDRPVQFDEQGNVVEDGGQVVTYESIRDPLRNEGNFIITDKDEFDAELSKKIEYNNKFNNVKNLPRLITNLKTLFKELQLDLKELLKTKTPEEAAKQIEKPYKWLIKVKNYLKANPSHTLRASVININPGFLVVNESKQTNLNQLQFTDKEPFKITIPTSIQGEGSIYNAGFVYFDKDGVNDIPIFGKTFEEVPQITDLIVKLFTSDIVDSSSQPLSINDRIKNIEKYFHNLEIQFKGTDVGGNNINYLNSDGSFTLKVGETSFKIKYDGSDKSKINNKNIADAIRRQLTKIHLKENDEQFHKSWKQLREANEATVFIAQPGETLEQIQNSDRANELNTATLFVTTTENNNNIENDIDTVYKIQRPRLNVANRYKNQSYDEPVIENINGKDTLILKEAEYNEYILANFQTGVQIRDGKIKPVNPFLQFNLTLASQGVLTNTLMAFKQLEDLSLLPKEYLNYYESGFNDESLDKEYVDKLKNQYVSLLNNLYYLSRPFTIKEGHSRADYNEKIRLLNANAPSTGKLRYQVNVYAALNQKLADLKEEYTKTPIKKVEPKSGLNLVINKESVPEVKPIIDPVKPVESVSEKVTVNSIIDRFAGLEKNAKLKAVEEKATKKQMEDAEVWYNNHPLSKKFPFKTLVSVINSSAGGPAAQWVVNGVILHHYYNEKGEFDANVSGNYTDLYHEAWHGFTQAFLTKEQKDAMYDEMRKREGSFKDFEGNYITFKDADWKQLEEFMAEEFRSYAMSGGKTRQQSSPVTNSIFRKILDFIKSLFGNTKTSDVISNPLGVNSIQELYQKLHVGDISAYTFAEENITETNLNYNAKAIEESSQRKELTYDESFLLLNTMDSLFSKIITETIIANGSSRYTSLSMSGQGLALVYQLVKIRLGGGISKTDDAYKDSVLYSLEEQKRKAVTDLDKTLIQQHIELVEWAIENFGDVNNIEESIKSGKGLISLHNEISEVLDEDDKIDFTNEDINEQKTTQQGADLFSRDGNEKSALDMSNPNVKRLLKSVLKFSENKPVINVLGVQELVEPHIMTNKISKLLINVMDQSAMYDILVKAARKEVVDPITKVKTVVITDPSIDDLLIKLGNPNDLNTHVKSLWISFWSTFNLAHIKLVNVNIKSDDADGYDMTIGSAGTQSQQIGNLWKNKFRTSPDSKYITRNTDVNEPNNRDFKLDLVQILNDFKGKEDRLKLDLAYDFLKAIGINLSDKQEIRDEVKSGAIRAAQLFNKIHRMVNERDILKVSNLEDIFKELPKTKNFEAIANENIIFNALMDLEMHNADYANNFMRTNAKGDTQYEQSLHNTISIMVTTINGVSSYKELMDIPYMRYLQKGDGVNTNNPWVMSSRYMNSIFNMSDVEKGLSGKKREHNGIPVKLNMSNLSGITMINEQEDDGVASSEADEFSKIIMDFHLSMANRQELMRHADKASSFSLWLDRINNGSKDGRHHADTIGFIKVNGFVSNYNKITNILNGYINSELLRINKLKSIKEEVKKGDVIYDVDYLNQGQEFIVFEKILTDEVKTELKKYKSLDEAKQKNPTLNLTINNLISNYFENQTKEVFEKMPKIEGGTIPFINRELLNTTISEAREGVSSTPINHNDIREALVRAFVVNTWINNVESTILIYGDVAQYNLVKEEFHKRNAGAGSTGNLHASDINSIRYVNQKGRKYAESRKGFTVNTLNDDGSFNTAILKDTEVSSVYYKTLYEAIRKDLKNKNEKLTDVEIDKKATEQADAYTKNVEGDGQGWITFDFYRTLSMLQDKWSTKQETLYLDIIAGKPIDNSLITEFFPTRKLQYWGPVKVPVGYPPLNAMHKFSLLPLIPSVVGDTNLYADRLTNLGLLHEKMINEGVDYSLFKSGSKISTITKISKEGIKEEDKLYTGKNNRIFESTETFTKNIIYLQFLKNQLDIAPYYKEETTFPTQMRKLIENGLMQGGVPIDFRTDIKDFNSRQKAWKKLETEDEKIKASDKYKLVLEYEKNISDLTDLQKIKLEKEANIIRDENGDVILNPKLINFIVKELERQDLGFHEINFLKNMTNTDLSISLSAEKIEKALNALVVRRLVKQKFNGEPLIQVSGAGFENPTLRGELTPEEQAKYGTNGLAFYQQGDIDFDEKYKNFTNSQLKNAYQEINNQREYVKYWNDHYRSNYNAEKAYIGAKLDGKKPQITFVKNPTTPMKVKIALQGDFLNLLKLEHIDGKEIGTRERLNEMLKSDNWLNRGDNRKMITIIGPRIPVQGLNSMEFAEVFEFLPKEAGNIVILPTEIVSKAGSDFDIDKLSFMFPNISYKDSKVIYNTGNTIPGLQNKILDNMRSIMELESNFVDLIKPNSTEIVKENLADNIGHLIADKNYKEVSFIDKKGKEGKRIAGTTIFEIRYNLYKHSSNNIGKQTLGLGAIDNTYNALLNRIGARMNRHYTLWTEKDYKTGIDRSGAARLDILVNHNVAKDDNNNDVISLSHLRDANNEHSISDIINQLMNGWVDIAKEAWIFNLSANKEITPVLLFLIQSGVPIKQAVYLVSNPLVREYVKQQQQAKSIFAKPLKNAPNDPRFYRTYARALILSKPKYGINLFAGDPASINLGTTDAKQRLYAKTLEITGNQLEFFSKNNSAKSEENLKSRLEAFKTKDFEYNEQDRAVFLHFLELEEMASSLTDLKTRTNVDTSKATSLFEAENAIELATELRRNRKFPNWMVDAIMGDPDRDIKGTSPIASFNIQRFQINLWKNFFELRNNDVLNNFILRKMRAPGFKTIVNESFGDTEKFVNGFRNNLVPFIFQNYVRNFDLDNTNNYKGIPFEEKNYPQTPENHYGVFITTDEQNKPIININKKTLRDNFSNNKYDYFQTPGEYYNFIIERELIRHQYKGVNGWNIISQRLDVQKQLKNSRLQFPELNEDELKSKVFESFIGNKALDDTLNNFQLFNSNNSAADQLSNIQFDYPDLLQQYPLLNSLSTSINTIGDKRYANIKLTDIILDSDKINLFHQNLVELSDPTKIKIKTDNVIEKQRVTEFFKQLSIIAFLQSGMKTTGMYSLTRLVPQERFTTQIIPYVADFLSNINTVTLDRYYKKFIDNSSNKRTRVRSNDLTIPNFNPKNDKLASNTIQEVPVVDNRPSRQIKIISNVDINSFNRYMSLANSLQPAEFFTVTSTFKDFYNDKTGKRETIPQFSKWMLQENGLYDLIDKETGEEYITNVNLSTGMQTIYEEPASNEIIQSSTIVKERELQQPLNNKEFLEGAKFAYESSEGGNVITEYTPENITTLKSNEVFVFGANTAGGHGGGTAGLAQRGTTSSNYTALPIGTKGKWSEYGVVDKLMQGTEGKSFGIVTKAASITGTSLKIGSKRSVSLERIEQSIKALIETAKQNPNLKFLVTKFGTNMAGFSEQEMKSLLENKNLPNNIVLPKEFEVRNNQQSQSLKDFGTQEQYNDYIARVELGIIPKSENEIQGFKEFVSKSSTTVKEGIANPADFTNYSGGAYGGDTFWDIIGREFGVTKHMHYKDAGNANLSQKLRNAGVTATILTKEQMDNARAEVERLLGQKYPDTLEGNLQVRNYYQVANADTVFAVAPLAKDLKSVTGGTNTAVQLGMVLNKPVYVWDITSEKWYKSQNGVFVETVTPVLTKNFAGVGSRDIENYNVKNKETGNWEPRKQYLGAAKEAAAKQAIRDVYANTFKVQPLINPITQTKTIISNTVKYTPTGKETQVYTIKGSQILNKDGKEVFSTDSIDRNKIFANLAIQNNTAVIVEFKDKKYIVNAKNSIMSVTTGNIMKWSNTDGNKIAILKLAAEKFKNVDDFNNCGS